MTRRPDALLIEAAASAAEAETDATPCRSNLARTARIPVAGARRSRPRGNGRSGPRWTKREDDFLRAHLGRLSYAEIARRLGRTVVAVHDRWKRDLHLTSPRANPAWFSLNMIACAIGSDIHAIRRLADRGILPAHRLPLEAKIRVVDRQALLDWLTDPMHWLYFRPERVGLFPRQGKRMPPKHVDVVFWRKARKQVLAARAKWKDEWLRAGDAARLIGIAGKRKHYQPAGTLNKAIHLKLIPAVRWGNWWVLRSDALRFERERVVHDWGPKKRTWIRYTDKPRMIYLRKITKKERAAFEKRRLRAEYYQRMRRRNREIRRRRKAGWSKARLARRYRLTEARIYQICGR